MDGTLIVSLDFELFWGMLDVCPLEEYQDHVLGGRAAIPELLRLFTKYDIHATWATVGFLFARDGQEASSYFPDKSLLPTYKDCRQDPYGYMAGREGTEGDCFYGPELIRQVAQTPGQEIGSHTFSHYYCRAQGQTPAQFAADIQAAKAIAKKDG